MKRFKHPFIRFKFISNHWPLKQQQITQLHFMLSFSELLVTTLFHPSWSKFYCDLLYWSLCESTVKPGILGSGCFGSSGIFVFVLKMDFIHSGCLAFNLGQRKSHKCPNVFMSLKYKSVFFFFFFF